MNTYVPVADHNHNILPVYAELYNKYWPGQEVTLLCYKDMNETLPDNFKVKYLGMPDSIKWANGLIPFFNSIDDEYFFFTIDDHLLMDYVDQSKVDRMIKEIENGASKAMLHSHLNDVHGIEIGNGIVLIKQDADYRTTIHPAIWTREYLLKYLKPNYTVWDFELKNMPESKKDGAKVVSLKTSSAREDHIFCCLNLFRGSSIMPIDLDPSCIPHVEDFDTILKIPNLGEDNIKVLIKAKELR